MRKIKLVCPRCGYQEEIFDQDLHEKPECALCGVYMEIPERFKETLLKDIVEEDCIKKMLKNIKELGSKKVWKIIETNFRNPVTRTKYRRLFFLARGNTPENENIIGE